jgi:uncharacterized protein YkuJ
MAGIKTRLDGRAEDKGNHMLYIHNAEGQVVAEVRQLDDKSNTLEIITQPDGFISKPSGWSSKRD